MLVTETNIYLPDRTHFSCSLSSRKKNHKPSNHTGVYCRFIMKSVQCCPSKLGRKGSERESVLGDCLLGPGTASAPWLCYGTLVFDM